jgi:hypothetical protein
MKFHDSLAKRSFINAHDISPPNVLAVDADNQKIYHFAAFRVTHSAEKCERKHQRQ